MKFKINIVQKKMFSFLFSLVMLLGCSACNKQPDTTLLNVNTPAQPPLLQANNEINNTKKAISLPEENEETVVINVGNFGRTNPFVPYKERVLTLNTFNNLNMGSFSTDLAPPPSALEVNTNVVALTKAQVSGILYDGKNSTAIINILGEDHLVHIGDKIFDFHIKNITKDKVIIRNGSNIYAASVGEIVEPTTATTTNTTTSGSSSNNTMTASSSNYSLPVIPKTNNSIEIKSIKE